MGLLSLLEVAFIPNLQVLLMCSVGAFLATDFCNLLPAHARISLNKIVFAVFTPCLMFANLAKTVTFQDIVSWWFMPVNIVLTFLFGGLLGWIVIKILKPKPYLEGLVMAVSSTGNLGYLLLIIIPAICDENGSPFGDHNTCASIGLSYASFSMALSGFCQWTYTYHLLKTSSLRLKAIEEASDIHHLQTHLLHKQDSPVSVEQIESQETVPRLLSSIWAKTLHILHTIFQESMTPPSLGAKWDNSLHHSYTRRQSHSRVAVFKGEAKDDGGSDCGSVLCTTCNWNFSSERGQCIRVLGLGPSLPFLVDGSIHHTAGHVHWYNDSVVRRWSRGMLCYYALDLFDCCTFSCSLVCTLHVDLVLIQYFLLKK